MPDERRPSRDVAMVRSYELARALGVRSKGGGEFEVASGRSERDSRSALGAARLTLQSSKPGQIVNQIHHPDAKASTVDADAPQEFPAHRVFLIAEYVFDFHPDARARAIELLLLLRTGCRR